MFTGTNVVQNTKPPFTVEFNQVWYEFGPNDKSATYTKQTEGRPVRLQKPNEELAKAAWEGIKPAAKVTVHDSTELLDACLADLKVRYPGTEEKPNDPILIALEAVSNQVNLWENNRIRQEMTPVEAIDEATAMTRMVKTLKAAHPDWPESKVKARAAMMLED